MVAIEEQEKYYNRKWTTLFSEPINPLELKRLIAILQMIDKIPLKRNMQILDLGCGRGWLASVLSLLGKTTAIDLSSEAINAAKRRWCFVDFRVGDFFEILKERNQYDLIVSQEVIEHVEDQLSFINLVADTLKLGGYFICTTPNAYIQKHRTKEEHERWGLQPIENWLDKRQLKELLSSRFELIEIKSIIPGYGTTGIFRIVNSYRLQKLLKFFGIFHLYTNLILRAGFGLHLIALAKRRI